MPAPAAPTNLTATTQPNTTGTPPNGKIDVAWEHDGQNVQYFKLDRAIQSTTGTWSGWTRVSQPLADKRSYSNIGLQNQRTYKFRICAFNASGNSAYTAEVEATTN